LAAVRTPDGYPSDLLALVEEYLAGFDFEADARAEQLVAAMRYSLLAGGKRIRPVLTLATARSLGADLNMALPAAAAVEFIHTYSLIHDDLPAIDDDTLRRGRPTCHVAFGEDVAILAGDGLFAEAFHLLLERQTARPDVVLATTSEVARATGVHGMVGGQFMDIAGVAGDDEALRLLHALKTGRLIEPPSYAERSSGAVLTPRPIVPSQPRSASSSRFVDDVLDEAGEGGRTRQEVGKGPCSRQGHIRVAIRHGRCAPSCRRVACSSPPTSARVARRHRRSCRRRDVRSPSATVSGEAGATRAGAILQRR